MRDSKRLGFVLAATIMVGLAPEALAKKVICIDAPNERAINNKEGYERALGIGDDDVVQKGGSLTDCLAMVEDGDELVIICHGSPGSFTWGGMVYTGFGAGAGQMPVPEGFDMLMNVTVRFCTCHSEADPPGKDTSVTDKIEEAMGGDANGHDVSGFRSQAGTCPVFELCGGTPEQRQIAQNNLNANRNWRDNPPSNRPGTGGMGRPANQQSAAQTQVDMRLGMAGVVMVKIPNAVGSLGPPSMAGYIEPIDLGNPPGSHPEGGICDPCNCDLFAWVDGGDGPTIPTVSEWGLVALALLFLTGGTVVFARRVVRVVGPA